MAACTKKTGGNRVPIRTGLVAEYRFDEGAGTALNDYSAAGTNDGTFGAGVTAPAWVSQGVDFETDEYISLTALAGLTDASKRSVFVVVIPSAIGINMGIIGKYTSTDNQRCWLIRSDASTASRFNVTISDSGVYTAHARDYTSPAGVLVNGTPVLIGFTFDTGSLKLYNGYTLLTPVKNTDDAITSIFTSVNVAEVGRHSGNNYYFSGVVCYAFIYNRVLTPTEIAKNYAFLKSYLKKSRGITI